MFRIHFRTIRMFSNTTKIIPCVGSKHYNFTNSICNAYFEHDNITGNKINFYAKYVRSDDNKCGIYKKILYKPIKEELEQVYKNNDDLLLVYNGMCLTTFFFSSLFGVGSLLADYRLMIVCLPTYFGFLFFVEKVKNTSKHNKIIKQQIEIINLHNN